MTNFVFDVGGVLVDNMPVDYVRSFVPDPVRASDFLRILLSDPLWRDLDVGTYRSYHEVVNFMISHHPDYESEFRRFFTDGWMSVVYRAVPEVVEIFEALAAAGYDAYILSNYAADGFANIRSRYPFFESAKGIVVSSAEGCRKPEREIYEALLGRYSLNPSGCVFIDDTPENLQTAENLGMKTILFQSAGQLRKDLQNYLRNA